VRGTLPRAALLWFAVLGAPAAWVTQFLAGYALTEAACNTVGRTSNVPLDALVAALTAGAAAVSVLAGLAAVLIFRGARAAGEDGPPPGGRVVFMAIVGMIVAPLMLAIILLSGVGVLVLDGCRQG
jgi:hypothetical protein